MLVMALLHLYSKDLVLQCAPLRHPWMTTSGIERCNGRQPLFLLLVALHPTLPSSAYRIMILGNLLKVPGLFVGGAKTRVRLDFERNVCQDRQGDRASLSISLFGIVLAQDSVCKSEVLLDRFEGLIDQRKTLFGIRQWRSIGVLHLSVSLDAFATITDLDEAQGR